MVVNWRREQATIECCRRLLAWRELVAQIILVDNGSGPETVARLQGELPEVRVLDAGVNRGFAGANNLALEEIDCDLVLLLNNDAELDEAAACLLLEFLKAEPRAGIAGPVLEAMSSPHAVLAAGGRDILRHGRTHSTPEERAKQLQSAQPFPVNYVPGTAALVRTRLLRQLEGLDEAYFFSGEMADLAARARGLGFDSFIVPSARARHDLAVASDLRDSLYAYYSLRNRFLYARRHALRPTWSLVRWTARGIASSLVSLGRGRVTRARCLARAVFDGARGRFGKATIRVAP